MKTRFVLVNPWIYDFAAFSLWARPLGLLLVAEYLSRFDADIRFIDCTDIFTEKRHGMGHYPREIVPKPEVLRQFPRYFARYGMGTDEFRNMTSGAASL